MNAPLPKIECPKCHGTGSLKVTVHEAGKPAVWVPLNCVYCDGRGRIDQPKLDEIKRGDAVWCRCGNPSGQFIHYRLNTDIYDCRDCGGLLQTG